MKHEEDSLQASCVQWFRTQYPNYVLFHIANGGRRNLREAVRLKKQGVLAGVCDLFLMLPNKKYHGFWIEMKSAKGGLTLNQVTFMQNAEAAGYATIVCRSFQGFVFAIREYLET
jgi:hypothetical protein